MPRGLNPGRKKEEVGGDSVVEKRRSSPFGEVALGGSYDGNKGLFTVTVGGRRRAGGGV